MQFNEVNYIYLQETVYNGPIAQSDWFAIYLKMVTYVRNPDLKTEIIAVTKFLILFTEDYVCKSYTEIHNCSLFKTLREILWRDANFRFRHEI